jgi:hypothetical protein
VLTASPPVNVQEIALTAALGTFHATATLEADTTQSATAAVSVVASGFTPTGSMSTSRSGHTAALLSTG